MPPRPRQQQQQKTQPVKKYEPPAKRRMELVASVSRSSGLEKDGDALRDFKLQEEYRDFIQGKVDDYWKRHPYRHEPNNTRHRDEMRGNISILFRKLREGILSTKRNDGFALEVYETSMYLSILFSSPKDATSAISHLTPGMYKAHAHPPETCPTAVTVSLLYYLVTTYPSQSRYSESLGSIPHSLLPADTRGWLRELTRALRQHNYAKLEQLTERSTAARALIVDSLRAMPSSEPKPGAPPDLAMETLCSLLDSLRSRVRDTTWAVLRSAYRELSCPKPTDATLSLTRDWLLRSLLLRNVTPEVDRHDEALLDSWIQQRISLGELRAKEGVEGRWIVCKVRA